VRSRTALDYWLENVWRDVDADYPPRVQHPETGLTGRLIALDGRDAVLIELPEPVFSPETFFAVVAPTSPLRLRRYLTYELYSRTYELYSKWEDHPNDVAILCESQSGEVHRNFGTPGDTTHCSLVLFGCSGHAQ
jgi:hypothetical protein